jgi:hypothetical protein
VAAAAEGSGAVGALVGAAIGAVGAEVGRAAGGGTGVGGGAVRTVSGAVKTFDGDAGTGVMVRSCDPWNTVLDSCSDRRMIRTALRKASADWKRCSGFLAIAVIMI